MANNLRINRGTPLRDGSFSETASGNAQWLDDLHLKLDGTEMSDIDPDLELVDQSTGEGWRIKPAFRPISTRQGFLFDSTNKITMMDKVRGSGGGGGGGNTNLTYTATATNGTVNSDTGTDAIIPSATTLLAGLLSATDKVKLDNLNTSTLTKVGNLPAGGATKATAVVLTLANLSLATKDGDYYVSTQTTNKWYDLTAIGYGVDSLEAGAKIIFNATQNEYIYSPAGDNQTADEVVSQAITGSTTKFAIVSTNVQSAIDELSTLAKTHASQFQNFGIQTTSGSFLAGDIEETKVFVNRPIRFLGASMKVQSGIAGVATPTTYTVRAGATDYLTFTIPANTANGAYIQAVVNNTNLVASTTNIQKLLVNISQNLGPVDLWVVVNYENA